MIYKGTLNKRGGGQGESGDLMVFLFDHALLMVKPKTKLEQYKVHRRVRTYLLPGPPRLTFVLVLSPSRWSCSLFPPPMTTRNPQISNGNF